MKRFDDLRYSGGTRVKPTSEEVSAGVDPDTVGDLSQSF